ncbi:MAG: N-acetyltransferase [Chloroflexi bacterium]|nr:N-acetyltransferase [Chloroflexota bacterium]
MAELGQVVDNPTASRFELRLGEYVAFAEYERHQDSIVFTHTEVPEELEGQGVGSALARGALEIARERGAPVIPLCPFIAGYLRRHSEYLDLVSAPIRAELRLDAPG